MDIDKTVAHMSLEQKCAFLVGDDFWNTHADPAVGVESLLVTDGPHGLRKQVDGADHLGLHESLPATCFPTASAAACSFDPALIQAEGRAIGEECRDQDVAVILGPGTNMKRSPLCGRNFEYFSEDPLLSGRLAGAWIRGVQSCGVGTSLKHFCGNNQETNRMTADSVIDERALHEIYLRPFELAIKQGQPWTIMGSYNRLNGTFMCENRDLLTDIVRKQWKFRGVIITDWGGLNDRVTSLPAGLDLAMPGPRKDYPKAVAHAIREGGISQTHLNSSVKRLLQLQEKHERSLSVPFAYSGDEHLELARTIAAESAVLLENDGILPLRGTERIALIGRFAGTPRYQGTGSSRINPIITDSILEAFDERGIDVEFMSSYDENGFSSERQMALAEASAQAADVAIVVVGLPDSYEMEGRDRRDMHMPRAHVKLIERVCAVNPNCIVVLQGGAPFEVESWRELPAATLLMYLSGCQGGSATVDLLLGDANPCGKLAETWPISLEDTPVPNFPDMSREIHYKESIFVGYRYYDAAGLPVSYPFGYGLSYTTFAYSDLAVGKKDGRLIVECTVTNTGRTFGKEAVQLYVAPINPGVFKAPQHLADFAKVALQPGESKRVSFTLSSRSFTHFDTHTHSWKIETGNYELRVSASSRDIRLSTKIGMRGIDKRRSKNPDLAPYYSVTPHGFDDRGFEALYGQLPEPVPTRPYTVNSTIGDLNETAMGRLIIRLAKRRLSRMGASGDEISAMFDENLSDLSLRTMSMGGIPYNVISAIADLTNGKVLAGLRKLLFSKWVH